MPFLCCWSKAPTPIEKPQFSRPTFPSHFTGAGCIFYNGTHVLAGYQPNKKIPFISGIGGKREANESVYQTAFRETLEELFGYTEKNEALYKELEDTLIPKNYIESNGYVSIIYSFDDLSILLNICFTFKITTSYYRLFPSDLVSLLFNRLSPKDAEISHLLLLPLVDHNAEKQYVDSDFLNDIRQVIINISS